MTAAAGGAAASGTLMAGAVATCIGGITGALSGAMTDAAGMLRGRSGTRAGGAELAGVAAGADIGVGPDSLPLLLLGRRIAWDMRPRPARNDSSCR